MENMIEDSRSLEGTLIQVSRILMRKGYAVSFMPGTKKNPYCLNIENIGVDEIEPKPYMRIETDQENGWFWIIDEEKKYSIPRISLEVLFRNQYDADNYSIYNGNLFLKEMLELNFMQLAYHYMKRKNIVSFRPMSYMMSYKLEVGKLHDAPEDFIHFETDIKNQCIWATQKDKKYGFCLIVLLYLLRCSSDIKAELLDLVSIFNPNEIITPAMVRDNEKLKKLRGEYYKKLDESLDDRFVQVESNKEE